MEKQTFAIDINAPADAVWKVLWGETSYNEWTAPFAEGSTVETNWEKGEKVLFLDGKGNGMISTIVEKEPNKFMSFKHLGMIKDGVEDFSSEQVKKWAGATENYTLQSADGKTNLIIDIDIAEPDKDYFSKTWPVALGKVKELAEKA